MKIDSKLIMQADKALIEAEIVNNGEYNKVFKGYISSFGASIAQAGLLPTIIFFEADSDQASDRKKVIDALEKMLAIKRNEKSFSKYIIAKNKSNDRQLLKDVVEAMTAMKLALRMYREKDD